MLMSQTTTQMTAITLREQLAELVELLRRAASSPVLAASCTACWIWPISVLMPVPTTTPTAAPLETVVPENIMLVLSWSRASALHRLQLLHHRLRLAGQDGLVRAQRGGGQLDEAQVGGHLVADVDHHDVAGDEVGGRHLGHEHAVAHALRRRSSAAP